MKETEPKLETRVLGEIQNFFKKNCKFGKLVEQRCDKLQLDTQESRDWDTDDDAQRLLNMRSIDIKLEKINV